jgi:transcriptional regulator with XRE-family HTH domain
MDDRTAGLVIRALRRRRGWRQRDLADRARVSPSAVSRVERGWFDQSSLRTVRAIFSAVEARLILTPRWHGAELERLLDEDHAVVVLHITRRLEALGWTVVLEVTYSEFGERGSIDVLGLKPSSHAIVVVEVKTDVASAEALGRKLDEKARLAPGIVKARFGWRPTTIGRLIVMPETMRLRRLVARHTVIGRMFPVDAAAARRWLREPAGAFAGLWFLSDSREQTAAQRVDPARRRIRPSRPGSRAQRISDAS